LFPLSCAGFFSATGISQSFLKKDTSEWANDPNFQHGKNIIKDLKVVNDCAERVAVITSYLRGNKRTVGDEERQHLLLDVAKDRKKNNLV